MKPLPIIAIAIVVIAVVAAASVFFLTSGSGDPQERGESTPPGLESTIEQAQLPSPTPQDQSPSTPSVVQSTEVRQVVALPELPWQDEALTDLEEATLASLKAIETGDPHTAVAVASLPWLADGIYLEEQLAIAPLRDIADQDVPLAQDVLGLPWLADNITDQEVWAINRIRDIAAEDASLAGILTGSQWIDDGVGEDERAALTILGDIAREDLAMARRMAGSPDIADGIDGEELARFTSASNYYLERIEEEHPNLARILRGFPWVSGATNRTSSVGLLAHPLRTDGLGSVERHALAMVRRIAEYDESLAQLVAGFPWVADGITEDEESVLVSMWSIASNDVLLAQRLADLPWVADDISKYEAQSIATVSSLAAYTPELAHLIIDQPWFQDGLTKEDAYLVTALKASLCVGRNIGYAGLIENPQIRVETISLDSGDVNVAVIRRAFSGFGPSVDEHGPIGDDVFHHISIGIEAIQEFMGIPWIAEDVVLFMEPSLKYGDGLSTGVNFGGYAIAVRHQPEDPGFTEVLYHELAHYYTIAGHFPKWLGEGTAELLTSYTLHTSEGVSLESRYDLAQENISTYCENLELTTVRRVFVGGNGLFHYTQGTWLL